LLGGVFFGWRLFWFLTDDAYITFRYISNLMAGYGLVWNPPPFIPVEGYTSFFWAILLYLIWVLMGVEPPQSANYISLVFGYATLGVGSLLIWKMRLPSRLEKFRIPLLLLALIGTVTNRTFLTWLSSGLETSAFNFFLTWWIFEAVYGLRAGGSSGILRLSLSAALTYLTRPDGILVVMGTGLILLLHFLWEYRGRTRLWVALLQAAPLLAMPAHLLWRYTTYGEWLPNTYYAKHVEAWPESGLRYAASFFLENGVWVWLIVLLVWLIVAGQAFFRSTGSRLWSQVRENYPLLVMLGVVLGHFSYYTLIIGGDHFEYRVYSHLILLLFASAIWLLSRITRLAGPVLAGLAIFILASYPIPWTHWLETKDLKGREETLFLTRPIAQRFPSWARPVAGQWDDWQKWLIARMVCTRHQEHKILHLGLVDWLPTRAEGSKLKWKDRPIIADGTVGVVGWILPEVAVLDLKGLNDWIVARRPVQIESHEDRRMAHDRHACPDYVRCLRPNVIFKDHKIHIYERELTDHDIRTCQEIFSGGLAKKAASPIHLGLMSQVQKALQ
jgi:arabinofuranosyltransferase